MSRNGFESKKSTELKLNQPSPFRQHVAAMLNGQEIGAPPQPPISANEWERTLQKRIKKSSDPDEAREALGQILAEYPDEAGEIQDALEIAGWRDPDRPPRPPRPPRQPPSLADARGLISGLKWVWQDWILAGQLTLVTGASGAGKSTLMADLARRAYNGEPWPDGTPQTIEPGRPVLWLNSDRRMDQLSELWEANKLPPEACRLAHDPEKPLEPLNLDDPETASLLREYVDAVKPWALIIDTIARATALDLCTPTAITEITAPLLQLSNETGIAIFLLGHTNANGQAYGRHLRTTCQVCWKLEGTSATSSRTLANDDRCVTRPPDPIGATIQIDGSWKWGEAVNPDGSGRIIGCASLLMNLIKRNGSTGFKDLLSQCEVTGGYSKGTVSKGLKTLVSTGQLIEIEETSKSGKKFKLWDLAPVSDRIVPDEINP